MWISETLGPVFVHTNSYKTQPYNIQMEGLKQEVTKQQIAVKGK